MDKNFFRGRKVLVMGLGRFGGGADTAVFAREAGAKVTVTDKADLEKLADSLEALRQFNDIEYKIGFHEDANFEQADIIIVNPAVNPDNEFLRLASSLNKIITSQMEIFFQLCPAKIVGITGSNGKSTTTALTAHLLRAGLKQRKFKFANVWLGGNIGNEPTLSRIGSIGKNDVVVLELSSFQLEQLARIQRAPDVSLITNLAPNHLDRHKTFGAYCAAKENMFKFQKLTPKQPAISVFNAEDPITTGWFERYKNQSGRKCLLFNADDVPNEYRSRFRLPGRANLSNLAGASAIAESLGVSRQTIADSLESFKSLPHRLELVARINDVGWYNDSIATTPESVMVALDAFKEPKIIIAGGYDKQLPFDSLGVELAKKAKAAVLIGQTAGKIRKAITAAGKSKVKVESASSLAKAIEKAAKIAAPGDVVLLSPACASYDMFDNFEHRGRLFRELVGAMKR